MPCLSYEVFLCMCLCAKKRVMSCCTVSGITFAGLIFTLNMRAIAANPGDADASKSQHCIDFALFQHHAHICDPATIQRISDTLNTGLILACLTAGGDSERP